MKNFNVSTDPEQAYQFNDENLKYNIRKMVRNRTDKNGMTKVIIEVCQYKYSGTGQYETKFKRVSTDVWVHPKNWNKKKEIVLDKDPEADVKNKEIDRKYIAVKEYINSKGQQNINQAYIEVMDVESLAEFFPSRQENRKTLFGYIDQYITHRKSNGTKQSTLKNFVTVKNRIANFDIHIGRKSYMENLDITWSDAFNLYMSQTMKYNTGTIEKTYTNLKVVLNFYHERKDETGIAITDKFRRKEFKHGTPSKNDANPLTREQLETLYLHTFTEPHLNLIKDRFLWQSYTGVRFCDAFRITKKDIRTITQKDEKTGKDVKVEYLWFMPSKTMRHRVRVEQPLNPVALEILKKYEYDMTRLKISNQPYNRELKDMFKKLNAVYPDLHYDENHGSYASRDSFISLLVDGGVSVHNILKYSGQSSFSMMDRYAKTSSKLQQEEINAIFKRPIKK